MPPLQEDTSAASGTDRDGVRTTSFAPARGSDAAAEVAAARTFVELLERATRHPDAPEHLAILTQAVAPWLAEHWFLAVQVAPHGFRAARADCGVATEFAAGLFATGLREIIVKQGVVRDELARLTAALATGEESDLARRLWEADLRCVTTRAAADMPFADAPGIAASTSEPGGAHTRCAAAEMLLHDLVPAAKNGDSEAPPAIELLPADRSRLQRLQVEAPPRAAARWASRLAMIAAHEDNAARRAYAADGLGRLAEALLEQGHIAWLRDALVPFQKADEAQKAVETPFWLEPTLRRLCIERNVLRLGALLDRRNEDAATGTAVREILAAMPSAVEPLGTLIEKVDSTEARKAVTLVLAAVAARDPKLLVECAERHPWFVARNLAYVLGRIGDPRVVPYLAQWAHHDDERVRIETARSLGRARSKPATDLLCQMLDDRNSRVRQSAVWALAMAADPAALPRLRQILFADRSFRSRSREERADFFRTYGRLADDATFAELARHLSRRQMFAVGWTAELRRGAALALGESGRAEAAKLLRDHVDDRDGKLRAACVTALAAVEAREHSPHLEDDEDWCEPERIGVLPDAEARFGFEVDDE